ncbi:MAG: hypothetical protein FWD31_06755, partial [Planctomycetaceae bacterium]|nr:hypothetical protein [Planctomycetaceae bacterium]
IHTLPPALQDWIDRELESEENLIWVGQPIPAYFVSYSSAGQVLQVMVGIPYTTFAVFVICVAIGMQAPLWFILFGILFMLFGLLMTCSPFIIRHRLKKTVYAITDRRAIIFTQRLFSTKIQSFAPDQLNELETLENNNGAGRILFSVCAADYFYHPLKVSRRNEFFNIPQVREVEQLLKNLAERFQNKQVT